MFNNGRKVMTTDQVISELRIKRGSSMEMNRSAYITGLSVIMFCLHTRIKYANFAY
jgi:hypothetical protein